MPLKQRPGMAGMRNMDHVRSIVGTMALKTTKLSQKWDEWWELDCKRIAVSIRGRKARICEDHV